MKIIISQKPIQELRELLTQSKNITAVKETIIQKCDYFCFFEIKSKKQLSELMNELTIYGLIFEQPLYVLIAHNEYLYEEEGLSKLTYWEYLRYIDELVEIEDIDEKNSQGTYKSNPLKIFDTIKEKLISTNFNNTPIIEFKCNIY